MFSVLLLNLLVFFLPTQLGLHFWPDFSRAAGIRVDYLSPTLYFTDIIIVGYVSVSIPLIYNWLFKKYKHFLPLFLLIILNTPFSANPLNTLFWWIRTLLYISLFISLRLNKITWSHIKAPLILGTGLAVFLEISQIYLQHSVGGVFQWLGERSFSVSSPGMARLVIPERIILRPPSFFSHPNSLAGYLLVIYSLLLNYRSPRWQKILIFLGIVLTFSKGALLAFVLIFFFRIRPAYLIITFLIFSCIQLFIPDILAPTFVSDRLFYIRSFWDLLSQNYFTGLGYGSYIPGLANYLPGSFLLPEKLQPIHNIFLLLILELGVVGVSLLIYQIKKIHNKHIKPVLLVLIAIICITGSFDHYWLTLPQNKLIIVVATALLL